jgi:hypothetical protein
MSVMDEFTNEEGILAGIPVLGKSTVVECIPARMIHFGPDVSSTPGRREHDVVQQYDQVGQSP